MTWFRLKRLHPMLVTRSDSLHDQAPESQIPENRRVGGVEATSSEGGGMGGGIEPTGTISAAIINPYADPGVPPLEGEDSTVDFDAAFGVVFEVKAGAPIPDPLQQLDPKERASCRDKLEDVIDAQRYGRSLGSVSRR